MALPAVGAAAPPIELPGLSGRAHAFPPPAPPGHALVAFFKVECPTCQLLLPYLQRYHDRFAAPELSFLAVSQDGREDAASFVAARGLGLPVAMDGEAYEASLAYGVVIVPSLVLVDPAGLVAFTSTGFVKAEMESLADRLGEITGRDRGPVWRPGDDVPDRRFG
jgi:peroxiredoxin